MGTASLSPVRSTKLSKVYFCIDLSSGLKSSK